MKTYSERKILGENLRRYRKKRNLTQDHLACLAGCHRTYISALERGRANPSLRTLVVLSRHVGVDVCYLLLDTRRMG